MTDVRTQLFEALPPPTLLAVEPIEPHVWLVGVTRLELQNDVIETLADLKYDPIDDVPSEDEWVFRSSYNRLVFCIFEGVAWRDAMMRAGTTSAGIDWPDVSGQSVLIVGVGGGSDIISAYVISTVLPSEAKRVVYANTKGTRSRAESDWSWISPHIARLPPTQHPMTGRAPNGSTVIDRSIPRGDDGCPWILRLAKKDADEQAQLAQEILAQGFDRIIAVDTGGDVLETRSRRLGRDRRMLRVLKATGLPTTLVVVGYGSDGQADTAKLERLLEAACAERLLGVFSLRPLLPALREASQGLPERRTPKIIIHALCNTDETMMRLPRGDKHHVPTAWLRAGFVFKV